MQAVLKYPKPVMKLTELRDGMGFPEEMLLAAYREKGQKFAQKINPGKKNSPIVFFTAEFEIWRARKQEIENRSMSRRT